MLVTPRPGVNRDNLLKTLRSVHNDVLNLRGGGGPSTAHKRLLGYLEWTSNTVRMLGNQVSGADLEYLVLTKRHELLLSGAGTLTGTEMEVQRVVNGLVSLELDQRVDAFDAAIKALERQIRLWSGPAQAVMPDTSFYIQHHDKLEEADVGSLLDAPQLPVVVFVPIVVVDELDRLKESKDRHVRWRAGYTLAVLDRVFADSTGGALLQAARVLGTDGPTRGGTVIEMIFDPPGHVRLPINDDEMIDRALAIEPLADRKITLLTYDTGQSMRARNAGLRVRKLSKGIGEEPTPLAQGLGSIMRSVGSASRSGRTTDLAS